MYLIFGFGTTVIDFAVSLSLIYVLDVNIYASKVIAWICAVIFAYVTNRIFVFQSENRSASKILYEASEFVAGRLISLGLQELMIMFLYEWVGMNELTVLIVSSILVVILNYVFGKLFVFRKK